MQRRSVSQGRRRCTPGSKERTRGLVTPIVAGVLTLVLLGWWWTQVTLPDSLASPVSTASPERSLRAAAPAASFSTGAPPMHIAYGAVGMSQAVLPLVPTEQETELGAIVPPETPDAYWLSTYGMPGENSTNTTYIVGHSWEGRHSPFNSISASAKTGDRLTITTEEGELEYTVDAITTEDKDSLKDSDIWLKVPNRLILITCYTANIWETNIIIQASPRLAG